MGNIAVRVEGLGKRYRLGAARARYKTIRDSFTSFLRAPFGRRQADSEFWALRDLSFDIARGDVVGIIGRNGAGKSTLLKILANITAPTEGEALIYGSLGALLEVGTGFHPELTGRENIYLSGAILGMSRADIQRRFDAIVDFAEIEKFLDTPAKHYSSGMYMRLAFSVAAHVDPQILIVDEVLAVGDANFQKKCLGKMEEVGREGRTVLFVSHSMPTVLRLCQRAMLLEGGRFACAGSPHEVVSAYLRSGSGEHGQRVWEDPARAPGGDVVRLHAIRVRNRAGDVVDSVDVREPVLLELEFWNHAREQRVHANFTLYNDEGTCLFATSDFASPQWRTQTTRATGLVRSTCVIPANFLAEGRVIVRYAAVSSYNPVVVHAIEQDAVSFQVIDKSEGDGVRGPYGGDWPGVVRPMLEWQLSEEKPS